jgi:recombinational DNA repair protein RecR
MNKLLRETNCTNTSTMRCIMWICPLCNGFETIKKSCSVCSNMLEDKGRIIDFFDDYSAYMEIDDMKKIDGYEHTLSNHECGHVLYCQNCNREQITFIKE